MLKYICDQPSIKFGVLPTFSGTLIIQSNFLPILEYNFEGITIHVHLPYTLKNIENNFS